ncbi:MAG: CHAD domain-containing protein [Burkholderiales bacterium]
MATETELKLLFAPAAARSILAWPGWSPIKRGRARRASLHSIYFDTPDRTLQRAQIALRLRRDGARWIQTLKAGGSYAGGLHSRNEFEWFVAGSTLDLEPIRALDLGSALRKCDWSALRPVFTTRFERVAFNVEPAPDALTEVAVDIGTIRAGRRSQRICEIELELKTGEEGVLFSLAERLVDDFSLRLGYASKAERGFTLASGDAVKPVKAGTIPLDKRESIAVAAQRLIGDCLNHLQANETGFLKATDPEYLHQLRVALRRLRTAMAVFHGLFPAADFATWRAELRWLNTCLAPARDADVWDTETLPEIVASLGERPGMPALLSQSRRMREEARADARRAVGSARYVRLILSLAHAVSNLSKAPPQALDDSLMKFVARVMDHRERRLRASDLLSSGPARLHEARLDAKKLRYIGEMFVTLGKPKRARRYLDGLARLQNVLGSMNDGSVGVGMLQRNAGGTVDPGLMLLIEGWLIGRASVHRDSLRENWRDWARCDGFFKASGAAPKSDDDDKLGRHS